MKCAQCRYWAKAIRQDVRCRCLLAAPKEGKDDGRRIALTRATGGCGKGEARPKRNTK